MSDPVIMEREDLMEMGVTIAREILSNMGIKTSTFNPWISKNRASKLVGRVRLEKAMYQDRTVEWKKDHSKKLGRIQCNYKDVQKLIRQPNL